MRDIDVPAGPPASALVRSFAGLRADILTNGPISTGAPIRPGPPEP